MSPPVAFGPPGDPGLPGGALLPAAGGGHVGGAVAEEVQVPRDSHRHRLRATRLLRTGEELSPQCLFKLRTASEVTPTVCESPCISS